MNKIINDLSQLTTIPLAVFKKLIDKTIYCISDIVEDAIIEGQKTVEIDLEIGILLLKLNEETVQYKFIPNKKLEDAIKNTIVNKENMLKDILEKVLVTRVINTYKDLL